MHALLQDLRFSLRMLAGKPGFTLVAVLSLALGIGANTAIFSVIEAVLLRPPPFKDPDQLLYVWGTDAKTGLDREIASPPDFVDWRSQNRVFEQLSAWRTWFYTLTAQYRVIDPDYFRTMGIPLLRGRPFDVKDRDESQGVAVVNGAMARRYWPADDPLGKRFQAAFQDTKTPWRPASNNGWLTIVGIAGDLKEGSLTDEATSEFYVPYLQNPSRLMRLAVRTSVASATFLPAIRQEVLAIDKNQPVTEIKSMPEMVAASVFHRRFNS
jgi:hypothetical protein